MTHPCRSCHNRRRERARNAPTWKRARCARNMNLVPRRCVSLGHQIRRARMVLAHVGSGLAAQICLAAIWTYAANRENRPVGLAYPLSGIGLAKAAYVDVRAGEFLDCFQCKMR